MPTSILAVVLDCREPRAQADFWAKVLDSTVTRRNIDEFLRRSARQGVRAGRGHEPLGHPVVDVMEPIVERASIELDGCPQ